MNPTFVRYSVTIGVVLVLAACGGDSSPADGGGRADGGQTEEDGGGGGTCGDGECSPDEDFLTCSEDCGGPSCNDEPNCGSCEACAVADSCAGVFGDCMLDADCASIYECVRTQCPELDPTCIDICRAPAPGGAALHQQLVQCTICGACGVACADAQSACF